MSKKQLYDVSEVVDSLVKTYKNINRKKKPVYGYEGPLLSLSKILACSPNIDEQFTEEGIEYHNERGRSLLHLVILSAFQLGIEQGINMCADDIWTISSKDWNEEDWNEFDLKVAAFSTAFNPKFKKEREKILAKFNNNVNENG